MRRQREHRVRVREIEAHALAGEPIKGRRRRASAVHAQRVGSERIDRDEENVLSGYRMEIGLRAARAQQPKSNCDDSNTRSRINRSPKGSRSIAAL